MKYKFVSLMLAGIFSMLSLVIAHGDEGALYYNDHHMGMMYGSYGTGFMAFGWIFSILFFVALILLIVWLIKQIQK